MSSVGSELSQIQFCTKQNISESGGESPHWSKKELSSMTQVHRASYLEGGMSKAMGSWEKVVDSWKEYDV